MNKKILWISFSLLTLIFVLGIFGLVSYKSAKKVIEKFEADFKITSQSEYFKNLASMLGKNNIGMFEKKKDGLTFNVLNIYDKDDSDSLLEALKQKDKEKFIQLKDKLQFLNQGNSIRIEKFYTFEDLRSLAKIGLFFTKTNTLESVRKLALFIKARLDIHQNENGADDVFINTISQSVVETYCVHFKNESVISLGELQTFTLIYAEGNIKGSLTDYIAYIIEKSRKKESE
ncbi:hypothetical protein CWI38_0002p0020 [Hamiltosporidium tvaerminnensis]|uniref:Uncharacterized protein n=1 Tax=Hamiltosporidium tvaerminnensis TaxID=1176355 RepID=A0A4Q9M4T2_9MICR|nr:hypothetical protein CWI38_0002p0020 [Hamiltosporidium tvaerminnensis]